MMRGQKPGPLSLFLPVVGSGIIFPLLSPAPRELWTKAANKDKAQAGWKPEGQARVRARQEAASAQQG